MIFPEKKNLISRRIDVDYFCKKEVSKNIEEERCAEKDWWEHLIFIDGCNKKKVF